MSGDRGTRTNGWFAVRHRSNYIARDATGDNTGQDGCNQDPTHDSSNGNTPQHMTSPPLKPDPPPPVLLRLSSPQVQQNLADSRRLRVHRQPRFTQASAVDTNTPRCHREPNPRRTPVVAKDYSGELGRSSEHSALCGERVRRWPRPVRAVRTLVSPLDKRWRAKVASVYCGRLLTL